MKKAIAGMILAAMIAGAAYAQDLDQIIARGKLVVGIRETGTTYIVDARTGAKSGFTYELAAAFAASLGVKLEIVVVPSFAEYWKKDGAIPAGMDTDPAVVFTPDIYRTIDMAAEILSPLPWREKLVSLVPFIDNTDIVVARKELMLASNRDLAGKRTFMVAGMANYPAFKAKMAGLDMSFTEEAATLADLDTKPRLVPAAGQLPLPAKTGPVRLYMIPAGTPFKNYTGTWLLYSNQADFTVSDYLSVLIHLWENPSFRDIVVPAYSFSGVSSPLCFSMAKDKPRLQAELVRFFATMKSSGRFSALVKKYTGFTYDEYKAFMGGR